MKRGTPLHLRTVMPRCLVLGGTLLLAVCAGTMPSSAQEVSAIEEGLALRNEGKNRQALEAFSRVSPSSPDYVRALVLKGAALEDLGRPDDAEEAYEMALKMDPRHGPAQRNINQLRGSRSIYVPVKGRHPSKEILFQKGVEELEKEEFQAALNTFRLLRSLFPRDPRMRLYCALTWDRWGEVQRAVEIYRRIVEDFPEYEPARVNLIIALIRAGDRPAAVKQTRSALEKMPDNHRIKWLARLLGEPGNGPPTEKSRLSLHEGG